MVKFLERPESTGDKLIRGLGLASESIPDMIATYQETKQREKQAREKTLLGGPSRISKTLKSLGLDTQLNEKDLGSLNQKFTELVNGGMSEYEALQGALHGHLGPQATQQKQQRSSVSGSDLGLFGVAGSPMLDFLANPKTPLNPRQKPFSSSEAFQTLTNPDADIIKENPLKALGSLGVGAVAPFEEVARYQSPAAKEFMKGLGFTYPEGSERGELLTEKARKGIREGLPENQQKQASKLEFLGGFLPIERIFTGLTKIGKSAGFFKNAEKIAAREGISAEQAASQILKDAETAGIDMAKVAEGDKQASGKLFNHSNKLAGRAGKPLETATEMRVARTKPEARIYPRHEKVKLREEHLKGFPKYEAEIAQDAAERAARAESRVPKTVKGKDSQKLRMVEAEKKWPQAQESFNKASGRVRALEEEVAKLKGVAKEEAQSVLNMAKKDLADAEFGLKQSFENLKGVNVRAGMPAMKDAARNKISQIQEAIQAGEEYKIAKMDYSPDLIKKAKDISKSKPIPKAREADFYTQVHDVYAKEYKDRISQINKEMSSQDKGLAGLYKKRQLQQEKDILEKMVESTGAEKTIQNRRFGLREMAEKHKAQERFKKLEPSKGEPKISKVAQEKVWKERIQEIKSPEGRSKVSDAIIEEASKHAKPEEAAKIKAEKGKLNQALDQLNKEKEKLSTDLKKPPSSPSKASTQAKDAVESFRKSLDNFLGELPVLGKVWKNKYGKDVLKGISTALLDEALKEADLNEYITAGQAASVILGNFRGAGLRYLSNRLAKGLIKKFKVINASDAYKKHDEEKFKSYSPSIRKQAKERAMK